MSWAARTEQRKDAGRPNITRYWADRGRRDATVRSRSPTTTDPQFTGGRPGARDLGITHLTMRFLTLIISLVAASAAAAAVTHAHQPASAGGGPELVASVAKRFSITGVPVTGLYPGATRPLTVK